MFALLKSLRDRWSNWTGDKELEQAIRRHLTSNGHYGGSAKLSNVRLAAVQRPGWLQIFRFDAVAKVINPSADDDSYDATKPDVYEQLYGLVQEDIRHDVTLIRTFVSEDERRELFKQWSGDLIQLRGGRSLA